MSWRRSMGPAMGMHGQAMGREGFIGALVGPVNKKVLAPLRLCAWDGAQSWRNLFANLLIFRIKKA